MKACRVGWLIVVVGGLLLPITASAKCGVERWSVKTGADKEYSKVDQTPIVSTVHDLRGLKPPSEAELKAFTDRRFPPELKVYTVDALLVGFKLESDEDFHVVIADLNNTDESMIAELPSGDCMPPALAAQAKLLRQNFAKQFGQPMKRFHSVRSRGIKIHVTGVGFFDFLHGQTGVAPNGFELHPVLQWSSTSSIHRRKRKKPTTKKT